MLVMTLIVHNEVDLLEANLQFHYALGVDHVLAIDDRSTDGTTEVLQAHARTGRLTLVARPAGEMGEMFRSQARWATWLARLAKTDYGADWVLNGDADEFWWPLDGSLTEALGRVGPEYSALLVPRTDFVLLDDASDTGTATENMIVREWNSPIAPAVAHRAVADIVVSTGAHRVARDAKRTHLKPFESGEDGNSMTTAPVFPIRMFHYPVRSWARIIGAARDDKPRVLTRDPVLRIMRQTVRDEDLRAMVLASGSRPPEGRQRLIGRLIRDGRFVRDTRVRDAILSSSPAVSPIDRAEEGQVAWLAMDALAREDRLLRNRAGRYYQQAKNLRSSRWWQLKDRLAQPARALRTRR